MPRGLILALAFAALASAAPTAASDPALAAEYGFETSQTIDRGTFQITAQRFKDVTGAYAASLEPANKGTILVGNYLVSCTGACPKNLADVADASLPHVSHGSLPPLSTYLPVKNLVPRSERYIMGPVGLAAYAPEIPVGTVLFDFGTEGEVAHYRSAGGNVSLLVFSFATPSLARQQLPQFEKLTGVTSKRDGPLVVVAVGSSPAAAKLLDSIDYQGVVSENEKPPDKPLELKPESAGKMVLAILSLAGLLLAFCLLSGLAVGGTLRIARRFGYSAAEGSFISLHLEGK